MEIHSQLQRNRLAGTVAVVTGVEEAPGSAIARRFAAEGARLVLAAPQESLACETIQHIEDMGGTALFVEADPLTEAGARRIVWSATERYGRIDTLVHSIDLRPLSALMPEGNAEMRTGAFLPLVSVCGSAMARQGEGSIVLTAWLRESERPGFDPCAQTTVRAELSCLVQVMAEVFYPRGLSVNAVELEDTDQHHAVPAQAHDAALNFVNAYRKARRFEDVAQAARFLASSEARGITGQVLFVGSMPPAQQAPSLPPRHLQRLALIYRDRFTALEGSL